MQNLDDERDLEYEPADDTFHLWGLMHARPVNLDGDDSHDSHDTFCIKVDGQGGVLTFASALDAEIYCQQLRASGMHGWTRLPLERIDLDRVMAALPNAQRMLMLALGFFASDTNNLLLDEDQTLITPLLPVPYQMQHSLHGMSHLQIHAEVCSFVEQWWQQVGGMHYLDEVRRAATWSDQALACCAGEALAKAAVTNRRHYQALWNNSGEGDECAVFSPQAGAWQFSTLRGPRARALH